MTVGVDIVENARVRLDLANRILTTGEYAQFTELSSEDQKREYLASRFAAKEAIIKATGQKYSYRDIEVLRTDGKPKLNLEGIELSISHERDYSVAFCIVP